MSKPNSPCIYPVIAIKEPYQSPWHSTTITTITTHPQPTDDWDTIKPNSSGYTPIRTTYGSNPYSSGYRWKKKQPKFTVEIIEEEKWLS